MFTGPCWATMRVGPQAKNAATSKELETIPTTVLPRRCIVSRFGVNVQMRQTLGRNELYLYLAPVAILGLVAWTISQHILVAQLDPNFGGYIGQFVGIVQSKHTAAGHIADLGEQGRAGDFLLLGGPSRKNADRVNLDVGFFDRRLDLALGVAAVVVAAIGNDEQCFL